MVGAIVALVCAPIGVFTVIRGQSFAGHAFADITSTGGSAAVVLGVSPLVGFVAFGVAGAGAVELLGTNRRSGRDLATGIVLGAALGLSALFLYLSTTTETTTGAAVTVLFGSIFAVSSASLPLVIVFGALALLLVGVVYRPLLLSSINPDLAAAQGMPLRLIGATYSVALALSVALSALTIGAILSTALLIGAARRCPAPGPQPRPGRSVGGRYRDSRYVGWHCHGLRQLHLAPNTSGVARQLFRRFSRPGRLSAGPDAGRPRASPPGTAGPATARFGTGGPGTPPPGSSGPGRPPCPVGSCRRLKAMFNGLFSSFMLDTWVEASVMALVAGTVGFFVVLRGSTFAAHAIPQGAFTGAAGAALIGASTLLGVGVLSPPRRPGYRPLGPPGP